VVRAGAQSDARRRTPSSRSAGRDGAHRPGGDRGSRAILPHHEHDRIWAIQEALDFPRTVFGLERAPSGETIMSELTRRYCRALGRHHADRVTAYHALPDP
jgi:hypothetical protein